MLLRDFQIVDRFGLYDYIDYCDYVPPDKPTNPYWNSLKEGIPNAQLWDFIKPLWEDTEDD